MKTSETIAALSDAIVKVQAELKNPPKNKVNPHFKSKYADLPAILETLLPVTTKHGVAVYQGTRMTETGIVLVTRLQFKNEWIESEYPVCQFTTAQGQMSALTYAKRAALQVAGLVCGDDDLDGEDSKDVRTNVAAKAITIDKQALINGIRACETPTELDAWLAGNSKSLGALPYPDRRELRAVFASHRDALNNAMPEAAE